MKNVLVTGASSELGKCIIDSLDQSGGYRIIGTMRRALESEDCFGKDVKVIDRCDLLNRDCLESLACSLEEDFREPFALIHSVGDFWDHLPFEKIGPEAANTMISSHINTLYNTIFALIPHMKRTGGGSVIAFSCNSVRYNFPWMASFTAAKSAVESLVRSLSNEYSEFHIRFNSLQLASLRTEKVLSSKPNGDHKNYIEPSEIVPVLKFLISDDSKLVTGSSLNLFSHSDSYYSTGYFQRVSK